MLGCNEQQSRKKLQSYCYVYVYINISGFNSSVHTASCSGENIILEDMIRTIKLIAFRKSNCNRKYVEIKLLQRNLWNSPAICFNYKKNNMSTDREKGTGNKRARVARGSRNSPAKKQQKKRRSPVSYN
jgi:hypothetical protein